MPTGVVDQFIALLGYKIENEQDLKKYQKSLDDLEAAAFKLGQSIGRAAAVAGAAVATGFGLLAKSAIDSSAKFEQFSIALKTIEGSAEAAKKALAWVTDFAETTPYGIDELVRAFTKLRAYGFDPMDGTLKTLGDTASAMSKSLDQAVEAFADAATGEFERLKEFGIRAKTQGDQVTFSWIENGQQMERTIEKTGLTITRFLEETLKRRYGGAMQDQARTWYALMAGMADLWDNFARKIGEAGFFDQAKKALDGLYDTLFRWSRDGTMEKLAAVLSDVLIVALQALIRVIERLSQIVQSMSEHWETFRPIVIAVSAALGALMVAAFPLTAALVALGAAAEDFFTYLEGGESVTGDILAFFQNLLTYVTAAWTAFETWWNGLIAWRNEIVENFRDLGTKLGQALLDGLKTIGEDIRAWFTSLIPDWAKRFFNIAGGTASGGVAAGAGGSGGGGGAPGGWTGPAGQGRGIAARAQRAGVRAANVRGSASFTTLAPRIIEDLKRDYNLTDEQAAGMVGNFGHETGGFTALQERNPVVPGSRGGFGWAQWTGPRRRAFEAYAAANNLDPASYEANYGFLKHELKGTHSGALASVRKESTVAGAAMAFEGSYEQAGIKHYGSRVGYGQKALEAARRSRAEKAFASTAPKSPYEQFRGNYEANTARMEGAAAGATINADRTSNSNVTVMAPVNVNVAKSTEAPGATARAIGQAIARGANASAKPSRMQATPAS
jgi:hypothetical protein